MVSIDLARLAHHGDQALCLFSDSTNAEVPGFCPPERPCFRISIATLLMPRVG